MFQLVRELLQVEIGLAERVARGAELLVPLDCRFVRRQQQVQDL